MFVLHELEGMAPAQIAEVVDCPVLTVRTRLFYARRELAEMMRLEPCLAQLVEEDRGPAGPDPQPAETKPKPSERRPHDESSNRPHGRPDGEHK